jgi:hypothetical protein
MPLVFQNYLMAPLSLPVFIFNVLQESPGLRRVYRFKEKRRPLFNTCDNWADG